MLDMVDASIDDVTRKTRGQVYDLLTVLQDMLASDADRTQITEKIETYKDRLAELV
ncbi:hypothetical protein [Micromonospora sp. DPT]|uniref:hypothetical protein n=1 Tax=Micromonospora sp. DPT TaxID=3142975 RepID=UPI003209829B